MRDLAPPRPIGLFVHHQGRGHATRAAALANALTRPVTIFCARDDIFPELRIGVEVVRIPSLFEATGHETPMDHVPTPDTLHCAPLGWPGIRAAMARMTAWFHDADPALMVCDVSAEVAQLARICSVPHVCVLQHGDRSDPGHRAAYRGAAGLLAPFHACLAQPDWDDEMRAKTHHAPGLGVETAMPGRVAARARLGLPEGREVVLCLSGAGGSGLTQAPLGVGARANPEALWVVLGQTGADWHATLPANLRHEGWVENAPDWIAAADLVVASTGNTTTQQILAAGRPWLAIPEWRYFDEQSQKARALHRAGLAHHVAHPPSSAHAWRVALAATRRRHDPALQRAAVSPRPAEGAAAWLDDLARTLWAETPLGEPA